jgi:antitoxin CptB
LDAIRLNRLRWRCRRGMLENDLLLERFLEARGEALTEPEVESLDRLLDLGDSELWDLLSGRAESQDAALRPLISALRRNGGSTYAVSQPSTSSAQARPDATNSRSDDGRVPPSDPATMDGETTSCPTAPRH